MSRDNCQSNGQMTYMLLLVPLVAVVAVVARPYDRCHVTCARATTATSGSKSK